MPDRQNASHRHTKGIVALILAFVAGIVDIIGYISFGRVFTAHLTGDTVHMGQALTDRHWREALTAGAIILTFFGGSMVGRTIIEIGSRRKVRSVAAATLLLEAGLLSSVLLLGNRNQLLLLALLAAAMGVQTATLTRVGSLTVHTTFVTGMVNKLAQLLSHAAFLTYDVLCGSQTARNPRFRVLRQSRFIFSVWFFYLLGAIIGTQARSRWQMEALLLPVGLVALLILVDLIVPLSIEEERESFER
jgi:uncharacterized membrane protein YoaK (UPF0700 family)